MKTIAKRCLAVVAVSTMLACASKPNAQLDESLPDASVAKSSPVVSTKTALATSAFARSRLDALRARFQKGLGAGLLPSSDGALVRFENDAAGVSAIVSANTKRVVPASATVALPRHARGRVRVEDDRSHMSVSFAFAEHDPISDALGEAAIQVAADGVALYSLARDGAPEVFHWVHAEGTEDFVAFERRPEREEIAYEVDVSLVGGLRLVSNTLEFLDGTGSPRLRVAPPYVVDVGGKRHEAMLMVEGCAHDTEPAPPWGRIVAHPGASSCRIRITWSGAAVSYPALVDPGWTATGSMAAKRRTHSASVLASGKVLVAGGFDSGGAYLSSAELYDPTTGTFAMTGAMAKERDAHTATVLASGKVLVAGGFGVGTVYLSTAELYDPTTGTFSMTGSLLNTRSNGHTASRLSSGSVLIFGGASSGMAQSSAEIYNPSSGTFAPTGSAASQRAFHTASVLSSGKVLVAGGQFATTGVELYDPVAGTFAATGPLPTARLNHTASVLASGKVLIAGGHDGSTFLSTAQLYDPATGSFSPTGSMNAPRRSHTATVLGLGQVLIAGGDASGTPYLSSAEFYDPTTGTFATTSAMVTGRSRHRASLLGPNTILVTGGETLLAAMGSAEIRNIFASGTACTSASECVSGICDIRCCTATCTATCSGCDVTGTCVPVKGADDPDTCTGTSTCDATGTCVANTYCTTDANCFSTHYCDSTGRCQAIKAKGAACNLAAGADCKVAGCRACSTSACVDGVCCGSACSAQCEACDVTGSLGDCTAVAGAPHGKRAACVGGSGTCAATCDGIARTACKYPLPATSCAAAKCIDASHAAAGAGCDGAGACSTPLVSDCGKYACNGATSTCKTSCTVAADCAPGFGCSSGACQKGAIGATCGMPVDCDSGNCVDNVCCTTASCATPLKCNVAGGAGVCSKPNGLACTGTAECGSGHCVDGYCCDTSCTGSCEACDVAGKLGACTPVIGDPHGARSGCAGVGVCKGSCDGTSRDACGLPGSAVECQAPSCTDGVAVKSAGCDGKGTCPPKTTVKCDPYVCGAAVCKTSCTTDADCAAGNRCDALGRCTSASKCSDDARSVVSADGALLGCAPYVCRAGACLSFCAAQVDCANSTDTCTSAGKCEPPADIRGDSSCSYGHQSTDVAGICALVALALLGRKREREVA